MALDKNTLAIKIEAAFKKAKETKPPDKPEDSAKVQDQILAQLSADLASAIDDFVKGGEVVGVSVQVKDLNQVVIGTGAQNNKGKVQ